MLGAAILAIVAVSSATTPATTPPPSCSPAGSRLGRRVTKRRKQPLGQSIGGVLFGFEQQVFRNQPPPHELVHQARPDASVPAGDGSMLTIELPSDEPGGDETDETAPRT